MSTFIRVAASSSRSLLSAACAAAVVAGAALTTGCVRDANVTPEMTAKWTDQSLFDIDAPRLDGSPASLSEYRGQVTLVVNTASKCGFTPQFAGLQALHERFAERGFTVIGFPSADFGGQELDTADEIAAFCQENYGVDFPMYAKVVTQGDGQAPVYEFLGTETEKLPGWNFGKYLVGRDGKPIEFYGSNVKPDSDDLIAAIESALAATDASG